MRKEEKEMQEIITKEALYCALEAVDGLDAEAGLKHILNSVESYIKILGICGNNIMDQLTRIRAGYHLSTIDDLKIGFHSLKGIFSNIGAEALRERSERLERAAAENQEEFVNFYLEDYIRQVERFVHQLDRALCLTKGSFAAETEKKESYTRITPEKYADLLHQAKEAVREYNFTEITRSLQELKEVSRGENREKLDRALEEIGKCHYDAVKILLEGIK